MTHCVRLACFTFGLALASSLAASAADAPKKDVPPVLAFQMKSLDGKPVDLADYKGKVLLIVNVASRCGATPQYEELQALHAKYSKDGLVVLGFPCNQFGKQEPGTSAQIAEFCSSTYGVKFPLFEKVDVNGEAQCDLYKLLTSDPKFAGPVKWNFEKFLVGRDGTIVSRFRTKVVPDAQEVVTAVEAELAKK